VARASGLLAAAHGGVGQRRAAEAGVARAEIRSRVGQQPCHLGVAVVGGVVQGLLAETVAVTGEKPRSSMSATAAAGPAAASTTAARSSAVSWPGRPGVLGQQPSGRRPVRPPSGADEPVDIGAVVRCAVAAQQRRGLGPAGPNTARRSADQPVSESLARGSAPAARRAATTADEASAAASGSASVASFADVGQPATVSCRLYRDGDGRIDGAPSVSQLREVIGEPTAAAAAGAASPGWLDALGRSGRGRVAPAERGLRAVHPAVLRSFAATGRAPEPDNLGEAARPFNAARVLAELADGDFLCLDQTGRISAAYPFSATLTPHTVQIAGGASVHAICAIDALGIARMLRASVAVRSRDPATGEAVTVTVSGADAVWHPATAVVFVGRTASGCAGPSAAVCCEYINFFAATPLRQPGPQLIPRSPAGS
jgi:hypothetical protein